MIRSAVTRAAQVSNVAAQPSLRAMRPCGVRSLATYTKMLDKVLGIDVHQKIKVPANDGKDLIEKNTKKIPQTHGIPVCRVAFHSFQLHRIDFYMNFCRSAAYHMKMPCTGVITLPKQIRRWTVLKSPFIHKSSMEVFERRTHKRLLVIYDTHPDVVQKWLEYINENIPVGVGMKYWINEHEPVDIGDRIAKALETGSTKSVDGKSLESTKYLQEVVQRGRSRLWTTYKDLPVFGRQDIEKLATDIADKLKANPRLNIEEVTRSTLMALKPPKEKRVKPSSSKPKDPAARSKDADKPAPPS
ncbi:mitochondrial 37S ribosomal protein rsm10 [Coemansia sp. RSA 1290]|nr:mitochondrial 37S ribosomal protein rsm10 [Coemansia sp. RSA 1290]KAJ2651257.1 mitochondrial 37S ribosomal protein rsm10 [Coemansia sp. RSA 1250]